ncbi:MAG: hypothetical protein JJU41_04035 [Bacteroidetes bacterium]|nr:hypothetical protein [Bacteroidota bacterium]MCH8523222.1 hypothetical protein [Balneolales bacterium]
MLTKKISLLLVAYLFVLSSVAEAQMFSVQAQPQRITTPTSGISAGVSFVDFSYRGPAENIGTSNDFTFSAPLFHGRLDLGGFSVYGIYGRGLGEQDNIYSELGAALNSGFILVPGSHFNVIIPLALSTEYVLARNRRILNNSDEFRQNNLGIRSGLQINARLSQRTRFTAQGLAGYAFSITGYGLSSGSSTDIQLSNRLYADRLFGQIGLFAGFDIVSRRYRLDDSQFNYRAVHQNLILGVSF